MSQRAEPTVSTLGPLGTYSHQAARTFFNDSATYRLENTITNIFESVKAGTSTFGVCPIENSTNGPVAETQDCLARYDVTELRRTRLKIGHALLRQPSARDLAVKRVCSHEQALGQCRQYLARRFPDAELVSVNSTALAASTARDDPYCVAVSSLLCASVYALDVLDTDIQDGKANETTFILFETVGDNARP